MPTVDQVIRARTRELGSIPYWVVEKDYAISYLLAGIARTDRLSEGLILKGGTALSKFYLENYRFSEDLDFTLRQALHGVEVEAGGLAGLKEHTFQDLVGEPVQA